MENIKLAFKLFVKEIIWNILTNHKPAGKKNIVLYVSRRSGSTLLMEVIARNKGTTFCDQPFGLYTNSPWNIRFLPLFEYSQVISMDSEEEIMIRNYINDIFSGNIHVNAPWKFWCYGGMLRSNRMVLKITDAKSIIDWIDKNFKVYTVIMTRHPIAQSLSVIRNKWTVTGKAFLRNSYFIENYLSDHQFSLCQSVYRNESLIERHVLDWALENLIPINLLPKRPHWIFLSYEELVLYPEKTIKRLAKELDLEDLGKMLNQCKKPSRSTRKASTSRTRLEIIKRNVSPLLYGWKNEITESEMKNAMNILKQMNMDIYQEGKIIPDVSHIKREN